MFTIQSIKKLQWNNPEHTSFSCLVKYAEFEEEHPSAINAIDNYAHIKEIWTKGIAGEYGIIAEYEPPVVNPLSQEQIELLRKQIKLDVK